jgi:hypothetical protein
LSVSPPAGAGAGAGAFPGAGGVSGAGSVATGGAVVGVGVGVGMGLPGSPLQAENESHESATSPEHTPDNSDRHDIIRHLW